MKATTKPAPETVEKKKKRRPPKHDAGISAVPKLEVMEAGSYGREEALALVGLYYSLQKLRINASNKVSAHEREVDALADSALIVRMWGDLYFLEKQIARGLKVFAEASPLGRWAMSNIGVGPVITAAFLAHIDINIAHTAGAIWRFAGLDSTVVWEKGCKRPYNAALKTICWKLGECFKRTSGREDSFYGRIYRERKVLEVNRNESGVLADQAHARVEKAKKAKWRISEEQKDTWESGKLQASGLDLRATRYAVKLFLSHYHTVGREIMGLPLVKPWVIEHGGHVHYIPPPNWPMTDETETTDGNDEME